MAAAGPRLPKLPRGVYWTIGAAIAFIGAVAARILSENASGNYRVAIWLAGGAAIFLGVAVLSMGTRRRLEEPDDDPEPREDKG